MKLLSSSYWGLFAALLGLLACEPKSFQAPLFDNLGEHKLPVTTASADAQRFFNQGLILAYGFNHPEAARSFREAARLDPDCAMCHWGVSLVLGPNINAAMDDADLPEAYAEAQKAFALKDKAQDWEQALIEALVTRYPEQPVEDRIAYDQAYAAAMREVAGRYPDHTEIQALTAEALMDLHPWDLWLKDGTPQPWTDEIVSKLEGILARHPGHPAANHLYIHAVEASHQPEKSLAAAKRLKDMIPGAGHLVHMPSHTYIRTGHYHEGTIANQLAVKADSAYLASCQSQGLYGLTYYPHNYHFLAACAALEGRGEVAMNAAFELAEVVKGDAMTEPGMSTLQHFYMIPHFTLVKFAQWERILKLPEQELVYPQCIWHYARGMAYGGLGDLAAAEAELAELKRLALDPELESLTIWDINDMSEIVAIAIHVLSGDIAHRKGDIAGASAHFQQGIAIEDKLNYNEPPDWFFSVRHHLGAALLDGDAYAEAEAVYLTDLQTLPNNGWALNGLHESLMGQGKTAEAAQIKTAFEQAWQYADTPLSDSRTDEMAVEQFRRKWDGLLAIRALSPGSRAGAFCGK